MFEGKQTKGSSAGTGKQTAEKVEECPKQCLKGSSAHAVFFMPSARARLIERTDTTFPQSKTMSHKAREKLGG